jgi:hypothetical protein
MSYSESKGVLLRPDEPRAGEAAYLHTVFLGLSASWT